MIEFKVGDIVVVISNDRIGKTVQKLVPIGMVTEIIKDNGYSAAKWYYIMLNGLDCVTSDMEKFRIATPREQFLYHLEGKPFVVEEE